MAYVIVQIALHFFMTQQFYVIGMKAEVGLDVQNSFYILGEICHLGNGLFVYKVEFGSRLKQRVVEMTLINDHNGAIFAIGNAP